MKIGLFTDLHYNKAPEEGRKFTALAPARVKEAMEAFRKEKVDVAVCLGDIVDKAKTHEEELSCWNELLSIIKEYDFPCYFLPGNHDYEVMIGDEFCKTTGMPKYPFFVDVAARRLVFLDACYLYNGKRYDEGGMIWTETMLPENQEVFLEKTLEESPLPCVIFTHQNFDKSLPKEYHIKHCRKLRRIMKKSGKVKFSFSGHFHAGDDHEIGGVRYVTVPSMTDTEANNYMIMEV